jgi:hypothetical protein
MLEGSRGPEGVAQAKIPADLRQFGVWAGLLPAD